MTLWDGVGVGTILIGRSHLKGAGPTLHVEGVRLGSIPLGRMDLNSVLRSSQESSCWNSKQAKDLEMDSHVESQKA